MRRPSIGQNGGDLSRLTSSSSDAETAKIKNTEILQTSNTSNGENSAYLPDFVEPIAEKSSSRKRKERQDSTSSISQDRKLVRSNSEEYIPNSSEECDSLRRVSSHEEFKKSTVSSDADDEDFNDENNQQDEENNVHIDIDSNVNVIIENNTNLSQKYYCSPIRDTKIRIDDIDSENELKRHNERFSKLRDTPRRKILSPRKSSKHSSKKLRERDDNCYKYDISTLKNERRGFISTSIPKEEVKDEVIIEPTPILQLQPQHQAAASANVFSSHDSLNEINLPQKSKKSSIQDEVVPWSKSFHVDSPIVCQRFSDHTFDHVTNSEQFGIGQLTSGNDIKIYGSDSFSDKGNNIQSKIQRDTLKKSPSFYLTADEKIKQINKRLIVLKKRLTQYEEKFEVNYGHKPSQNDKSTDIIIKNLSSEITKLRKEKHSLRSEPRNFLYNNNNNNNSKHADVDDMREDLKLNKMKETLLEIEKRLVKKRSDEKRSPELEQLTPDELIKEKTAVQKGLLYLESIFGRPVSRDERDAARPLYDRYRVIKRLVNRNATLSSSGISVPELPTILEHEAMAFTGTSSSNQRTSVSLISFGESTSDTSDSIQSTDSTDTSSSMTENVHTMSIQELWTQFDTTREETRNLKKTIKEFEDIFEERNGRKMLKTDRKLIEETYNIYKQKKAKVRLLDALIKKHMSSF